MPYRAACQLGEDPCRKGELCYGLELSLMKIVLGLALFLTALPAVGSSVTASCDPPGPTIVGTFTAQCSGQGTNNAQSNASVSINLQLAANPADFSLLNTAQTTSANFTLQSPIGGISVSAATSIRFDEYLTTAGPVRPGYVIIQAFSPNTLAVDGSGGQVVFNFPANSAGTEVGCSVQDGQECVPSNATIAALHPLNAISLGVPVELTAQGSLTSSAYNFPTENTTFGGVYGRYEFRFVEADGVTPVAVSETPEPSTVLLLGAPLLAVLARKKKVKSGEKASDTEPAR